MSTLSWVRLINFQAWKDIKLDFCDGLNVIIGQNNAGKSIFMKAIKMVVVPTKYSREDRSRMVRFGCDVLNIEMMFSDGNHFRMDCMSNGKYVYYMFCGGEIIQSNECFPEWIDGLSVLVDIDGKSICNMLDLDTQLLMVQAPPGESLMRAYVENPDLINIKSSVDDMTSCVDGLIKDTKVEVRVVSETVKGYVDVDLIAAEEQVIYVEGFAEVLHVMQNVLEISEQIEKIENVPSGFDLFLELGRVYILSSRLVGIDHVPDGLIANFDLISSFNDVFSLVGDLSAVQQIPDVLNKIDDLAHMSKVLGVVGTTNAIFREGLGNASAAEKFLKDLADMKAIVECNLFGSVIFDGVKCVAIGGDICDKTGCRG